MEHPKRRISLEEPFVLHIALVARSRRGSLCAGDGACSGAPGEETCG